MVSENIRSAYSAILNEELVPALGCTEPIAVAYAAARAREILGRMPEGLCVRCSGNIVKNVKGVRVPNTGGLKGIAAAAVAGVVGGDASRRLEVLEGVRPDQLEEVRRLLAGGYCEVSLAEGVENLFIEAEAFDGDDTAVVRIEGSHTNITLASRNGESVRHSVAAPEAGRKPESRGDATAGPRVEGGALASGAGLLNIRDILEYAETADLSDVERVLADQIEMNRAISDEGLNHAWGAQVGKTLLKTRGTDVRV
ncbi:MAG TPA: serine dehydratase subunit alpha family protein, partial [Spirochaetia bacterium]|nr:serine dehydratase subunit alpha family protein [Spirochaetia bacterium]